MFPDPYRRLHDWIWTVEPVVAWRRHLLHVARYVLALLRDLIEGEISLRAMSLVYTTLLSLVPFLALAFSVLKALGVHDSLQPLLLQLLQPLGDQATVISHQIIGFVDNIKVGVLGAVGVVTLFYTAVSMISKIESSFNFIWAVGRTRAITQRFSEYLTVLLVGPILVFAALGMTASLRSSALVTQLAQIEPFGTALLVVTKTAPYVLIVLTFTFFYGFIPNTRVGWRAAFSGGLFAGVAWESASAAFATFVARSSQYSAIYSGFAIVIVLLIWLYVGWLIVLFGCRLAFYVQNPAFLRDAVEVAVPGSRESEVLALRIASLVCERFVAGDHPPSFEELRHALAAPAEQVRRQLQLLQQARIVTETAGEARYVLTRDPDTLDVAELWRAARGPMPAAVDASSQRAVRLLDRAESGGLDQAAGHGQDLRSWSSVDRPSSREKTTGSADA